MIELKKDVVLCVIILIYTGMHICESFNVYWYFSIKYFEPEGTCGTKGKLR